jgi:lysine 2,3-aminomutase
MNFDRKKSPSQTARRSKDLLEAGLITPAQVDAIGATCENFSMAITPTMMHLVDVNDTADPIARQFIPTTAELAVLPEERADPIGDDPFTPIKGITHRYPDRVLLKPVHVCPVYCRFCFRREKVGTGGEGLSPEELDLALDYIRNHADIWEVILTGGDPLILSKPRLKYIIEQLNAIAHVEVIRIHTRVPVVDPARVDAELAQILRGKTPVYVVLHSNHPREMTPEAERACATLVDAGIPMLSQCVLLKGVNDDPATMTQLMRGFIRNRIKPYYLHHGDMAQGTSHFRTTVKEGQSLMRQLRGRVSGICQPTYVLDIPGGYGKVPIGPQYISTPTAEETYLVEDPWSQVHEYPPSANSGDLVAEHAGHWT